MTDNKQTVDICLISEGSYPYYSGGVAQWTHELITEHKERTFHVLTLMPPHPHLTPHYRFPSNVVGHTVQIIQYLSPGASENQTPESTWEILGKTLKGMMTSRTYDDWTPILNLCVQHRHKLGQRILTESSALWNFITKLYEEMHPWGPFKDFFSTAFVLNRSLFSILLPELPPARLYHALCTGYAGFYLKRAKYEKHAPCLLTEQGIYTNERRIEIAMADWISDIASVSLDIEDHQSNLKDYWLNAFQTLAHACYTSCDAILSTYDGNQEMQLDGGADPEKMKVILHGIHPDHFPPIKRERKKHAPVVAFVGRIVPIKDVKTFIRACHIVKQEMPDVRFYLLGPKEEDEDYFTECQNLVTNLGLEDSVSFFGKVNFKEFLPEIDLLVLTSLSEAQPLVILEAGSTGLPFVASNVGACYQLCYGRDNENPPLGQAGLITGLANPEETAKAILTLLRDDELYENCSKVIQKRVQTYYKYDDEHREYRKLYSEYLGN